MADIYNMLRQFGQDVSGAITAGPEARMKTAQFKHAVDEDRTQKLRQEAERAEEERKQIAKQKASQLLSEGKSKTPEFYQALADSGESPMDIEKLRLAQQPKPKKPDAYKEEFNMSILYAQSMQNDLGKRLEQLNQKAASGEDVSKDMEEFSARYEAGKASLERYVADFEYKAKSTYANGVSEIKDQILQKYDPQAIEMKVVELKKATDQLGGDVSRIMDRLDNDGQYLGVPINLSGIPSTADIKKMAAALISKEEASPDEIIAMQNIRDPNGLKEVIEDPENSENLKKFAGVLLRSLVVAESMAEIEKSSSYKKDKKKKRTGNLSKLRDRSFVSKT